MDLFNKLSGIAKNIGGKANEVVESTKLSVKISGEKDKVLENQRKIGEYYYQKLVGTPGVDADVKEYFDAITQSQADIAEYEKQKDEEAQKNAGSIFDTGAEEAPKEIICPNCGAKNDPQNQYCYNCGAKLPRPEAQAPAQPQQEEAPAPAPEQPAPPAEDAQQPPSDQ